MNLAGGQKKAEESELIDLAVSSTLEHVFRNLCKLMPLTSHAVQRELFQEQH